MSSLDEPFMKILNYKNRLIIEKMEFDLKQWKKLTFM